jgi:hypothetical protein
LGVKWAQKSTSEATTLVRALAQKVAYPSRRDTGVE